ncbi:MAG: NlpC/P60 family protein [Desulfuromonadaceae bacterium]|nr:NlpC/P60 family protein [Desulfuromonadaceae bacterium]
MGGGGGGGHFSGTKGASDWNPFSRGTVYAQAGNGNVATDAGGKAAPAIKPWNKEASIEHLDKSVQPKSTGYCATYVREAIEAGGIHLNRSLNSAGGRAYGYGPVLEDAGFKPVPADTPPQAGDVVIIQQAPHHKDGHAAMYDGKKWISDFEQKDIYGSPWLRKNETPYIIYRRT